jgi:hypothetical protein
MAVRGGKGADSLAGKGYTVTRKLDEQATVVDIVRNLSASPGFVFISTHGGAEGALATGTYLGTEWRPKAAYAEFKRQQQIVADAGYGDLLTYTYNGESPISIGAVRNGMTHKWLNGHVDWGDGKTVADHFHGYTTLGPNSTNGLDGIMEFAQTGWLGAATAGKVNAGDVWWVLFGGRWSSDAQGGAASVKGCWDQYWSGNRSSVLGDVFCHNCSPGTIPNQDVVAYSTYLLTGQAALPFGGITVPRWTLNDGAP